MERLFLEIPTTKILFVPDFILLRNLFKKYLCKGKRRRYVEKEKKRWSLESLSEYFIKEITENTRIIEKEKDLRIASKSLQKSLIFV